MLKISAMRDLFYLVKPTMVQTELGDFIQGDPLKMRLRVNIQTQRISRDQGLSIENLGTINIHFRGGFTVTPYMWIEYEDKKYIIQSIEKNKDRSIYITATQTYD